MDNKKIQFRMTSYDLLNMIISIGAGVLSFIVVVYVCGVIFSGNGIASETYYNSKKPIIITSESMEPALQTNGLVIVETKPYSELQVGDIILFTTKDYGAVLHRIQDILPTGIITKGDNNAEIDTWIVNESMYSSCVVEVHNWVAKIITPIFGNFNADNSIRLYVGLVVIALLISLVVAGIMRTYDMIFIYFFIKNETENSKIIMLRLYEQHFDTSLTSNDIREVQKLFSIKRNIIQHLIFRWQVVKFYDALDSERKKMKKVKKRYAQLIKGGK